MKTLALALLMSACASAGEEATGEMASSEDELVGWSTDCKPLSRVPGMKIERRDVDGGKVHVRIGVMDPKGGPKADVLFMHGFADRFDNHLPLFEEWRDAGFRVIAFDYPSHGETCGRGLDRYKINGLIELAAHVVHETRPDRDRPLLLAGWSTGGLLAVRMLQSPKIAPLDRPVDGAFLLAPGVDVRVLVGDKQRITLESLTHDPDPPHAGPIRPTSPMQTPFFSADLVLNAKISRQEEYPKTIPTYVVTGGEREDVYAKTSGVKRWVEERQKEGARIEGLGCDKGRHELDNEAEPIRNEVRGAAVRFATWVAGGAVGAFPAQEHTACKHY